MAKYYVQCGPLQTILTADSADQAALGGLDRAMQSHLWIYDDPDLSEQDRRDHIVLEALIHLDPTVRVSQRGFDRGDAQAIGTPETIDRWHRLMVGMRRLFITAGLAPRTMADVAGTLAVDDSRNPKRPR